MRASGEGMKPSGRSLPELGLFTYQAVGTQSRDCLTNFWRLPGFIPTPQTLKKKKSLFAHFHVTQVHSVTHLFKYLLFCVYGYFACVSKNHIHAWYVWMAEEGIRSPEISVTVMICQMSALSHLSSPLPSTLRHFYL